MTEQPGRDPEQRLPAERPEVLPVERLSSPPSARRFGLTSERAATIVRQSANARWISFLLVTAVAVFVIAYYFYEVGVPGVADSSRLAKTSQDQQVTAVERGYDLYQANCARCHGQQGQGGIGPVLNDQAKLLAHLTTQYIHNVLTVGGRYVCGDANSLMPIWSDTNGGPLNYEQIDEIIAFLRAPKTVTWEAKDPVTGATVEQQGWRDPNFTLAPDATAVPACWKDAFTGGATPAPSGSPAPSGAPSEVPAGTVLRITAANVAYDVSSLEAPADTPFSIEFTNNDPGIPHNVAIHQDSPTGQELWQGDIVTGVTTITYQVAALPAGTYGFVCTVHPNMTGTLTVK